MNRIEIIAKIVEWDKIFIDILICIFMILILNLNYEIYKDYKNVEIYYFNIYYKFSSFYNIF